MIINAIAHAAAPSTEKSLRPVVITVVTLKLIVAALLLTSVQITGPVAGTYNLTSN